MLHGSILPVSCVPPVTSECPEHSNEVKPLQPTCHILLCSYRAEDGQDVLDAWHSLEWEQFTHCEITHLIFSDDRDLLDIMILLDQVRHRIFYSSFYLAASCYLVKIAEFAGPGSGTTSFPPVPSGDDRSVLKVNPKFVLRTSHSRFLLGSPSRF